MIPEVDAALESLVRREALNGSRVEVTFDAPTKDWVARRNAPTVDLYLYDIREDLPRREVMLESVRNDAGLVTEHRMPPRRYRLSYLVTAWTQRPEDEHRILAACLGAFVRNEVVPLDLMTGSLANARYPIYLTVGLPPPQDRSIADVWSALGGELKPSLDVVATAPLDPNWSMPAAGPVLEGLSLGVGGPEIAAEAVGGARGPGPVSRVSAPLGPDDEASQVELIRGGGVGVTRAEATTDEGKAPAKGRRKKAADTNGEPELDDLDLSGFGRGRIVRVRGIPRP